MIAARPDDLRARAEALAARLDDPAAGIRVVALEATVGGGSLPGETLAVVGPGAARVAAARLAGLRRGDPAVIARIEDGRVVLDLRTVDPARDEDLARAIVGYAAARLDARPAPNRPHRPADDRRHRDGRPHRPRQDEPAPGADRDRRRPPARGAPARDDDRRRLRPPRRCRTARELDFVDVPGHDRLVGNMLVGAGEIDAALLVVAADDGPRAQTLEHLELLDALGIREGIAVVTKIDLVDRRTRRWRSSRRSRGLLGRTTLAGSPVLPVSSSRGDGLDELRDGPRRAPGPGAGPRAVRPATRRRAGPSASRSTASSRSRAAASSSPARCAAAAWPRARASASSRPAGPPGRASSRSTARRSRR